MCETRPTNSYRRPGTTWALINMKIFVTKSDCGVRRSYSLAFGCSYFYVVEGDLRITLGALKEIPHVVFIYAIIYVLFTTWAWRWRMFSGWLIPFPDLEGTWRGTVVSTWRDPETGQAPPPIEAMLVIRQKFDSISCTLFTAESESQSNAAALQLEEGQ